MIWTVKRIQEDDYGCEERAEDAKATVLVTLVNEKGQERLIRVEDDWLYAKGIDEGDRWPEGSAHYNGFAGMEIFCEKELEKNTEHEFKREKLSYEHS